MVCRTINRVISFAIYIILVALVDVTNAVVVIKEQLSNNFSYRSNSYRYIQVSKCDNSKVCAPDQVGESRSVRYRQAGPLLPLPTGVDRVLSDFLVSQIFAHLINLI